MSGEADGQVQLNSARKSELVGLLSVTARDGVVFSMSCIRMSASRPIVKLLGKHTTDRESNFRKQKMFKALHAKSVGMPG